MKYLVRDIERLLGHTKITKIGCWEWQASCYWHGYGQFNICRNGVLSKKYAHRVAYEVFVGPIKDGLFICHHCDNKKCIRPSHLFQGTQTDNMRDMMQKNRANNTVKAKGSRHHMSKLKEEEARLLLFLARRTNLSHRKLGLMFRISQATANKIIKRVHWKHVIDNFAPKSNINK